MLPYRIHKLLRFLFLFGEGVFLWLLLLLFSLFSFLICMRVRVCVRVRVFMRGFNQTNKYLTILSNQCRAMYKKTPTPFSLLQ